MSATCPYGGHPSIKYGTYKGVQRYYCNTCERKFTLQDTFFNQHHDRALVVQALNFFGRHQHLEGRTPADRAGISNGIRNWADLLEQAVPSIKELGSIALPRGCLRCVNADEWQHGGHQHD